jgi:hypothetical protein
MLDVAAAINCCSDGSMARCRRSAINSSKKEGSLADSGMAVCNGEVMAREIL